ncbi:MAG: redoxin domain-containing protein [Pirellulaceae bacterium]|nr:redoxin domain-containing protein [Planctomycetales bacterium]
MIQTEARVLADVVRELAKLSVGVAVAACVTLSHAAEPLAKPTTVTPTIEANDLYGVAVSIGKGQRTKLTVVIFITTDCPIANSYHPTIEKLRRDYAGQDCQIVLVHEQPGTTTEAALTHAKDYAIAAPILLDKDHAIARSVGATVTPEAVVVDGQGMIRYRGRIDDRYATFGKKRPQATRHDLQDAMVAALQGKQITPTETKAVGCLIRLESSP